MTTSANTWPRHPYLEEVFKLSGIPTVTFVKPLEYEKLLVSLRTPGRGVVIEGPSGIGKTTAVTRAVEELGLANKVTRLSARKTADLATILGLPTATNSGLVIIDDFHRLDEAIQASIADFLKVLADEERTDTKVVVVGINRTGDSLVQLAADLNTRIDTLKFEANPDSRVSELITKGEVALNVAINTKNEIIQGANGSFFIAQMLCHETCLSAGVTQGQLLQTPVTTSFETIRERVMETLSKEFADITRRFACGTKLKREGRAPYLHVLKWLAEANEWTISLEREMSGHPEQKGSVGQIVEKGYLASLIENDKDFGRVLHYQPRTTVLSVEDPKYVFFIRNLSWNKLAKEIGFFKISFDSKYDFALSFAGSDRDVAQRLFDLLTEEEFSVFYDKNEQHRILAEDVEEYLAPIYRSEASYVICLLGKDYPKRVWTKIESNHFRKRFESGAVIPVWFTDAPPGIFDESGCVGGVHFDPAKDIDAQLQAVVALLKAKVRDVASGDDGGDVEEVGE